jgi:DNA-binding MarR family transcriptional regulator
MFDTNEQLLMAWLRLSSTVNNERIVSNLSFNEALVCDVLYYRNLLNVEEQWTAADLCRLTHMHKTLMNRTLKSLEKKEIIVRKPDPKDKRKYFLNINPVNFKTFLEVHEKTLELVKDITAYIGEEKAKEATESFHKVAEAVDHIIYKKEKKND